MQAFVIALFRHFMEHKVYVTPGSEMRCADPGWFRVVFSAAPHILEEGMLYIFMVYLIMLIMCMREDTAVIRVDGNVTR
jgi:hypothetical protein